MRSLSAIAALLFLILSPALGWLAGCSAEQTDLSGQYRSITSGPEQVEVVLALKQGGDGEWIVDGESTPFKWEVKDGALWLHAKDGGAITAELGSSGLVLDLPGVGRLEFKKTAE